MFTLRHDLYLYIEDPYEEAARQFLEQAPRSPEYVPDPMELKDHVPVYIPEPEHPEDLVPAEDEAPIEAYITEVAFAPPPPPSFLHLLIRPPPEEATTYALRPGCEVRESSAAAAARQPGPTMARRVDCTSVDTVETRVRDTERSMMVALEVVNLRDRAAIRAEIEALEAGARDDTLEDTGVVANGEAEASRVRNGYDSNGSELRPVQAIHEYSYSDFKGTKGVVRLTPWFEKIESVFSISNCTASCQVKFATCTLQDDALTWWNAHVKTTTPEATHAMS
ncbi:hypothetical protein Tco_0358823 [Tanacetum coccineum]